MTLNEIVDGLKINKTFLAESIDMPKTTFNNKLNSKISAYKFKKEEYRKILLSLLEISQKIGGFVNNELKNNNEQ